MLSFKMPYIIINDKYTGAILWSTGVFAYTHNYTHAHTAYIRTSSHTQSPETMAAVHIVHVSRLFHQSIVQWDTNWAGKGRRHIKEKDTLVFRKDFSIWEVADVMFFIKGGQLEAGLTKDGGETCSPSLSLLSRGGRWGCKRSKVLQMSWPGNSQHIRCETAKTRSTLRALKVIQREEGAPKDTVISSLRCTLRFSA